MTSTNSPASPPADRLNKELASEVEDLVTEMECAVSAVMELVYYKMMDYAAMKDEQPSARLMAASNFVLKQLDATFRTMHDRLYATVITPGIKGPSS